MRGWVAAFAFVAVLAGTARGEIANGTWSGTSRSKGLALRAIEGEFDGRGGPLRLDLIEESVDLQTTDSGWTMSGTGFGTLGGTFGTLVRNAYLWNADGQQAVDWLTGLYDQGIAGWSVDTVSGVILVRSNSDASRVKVQARLFFTGRVFSGDMVAGTYLLKAKLTR